MDCPILTTDRLRLEPWTPQLVDEFVITVLDDPIAMRHMPAIARESEQQQRRFTLQVRQAQWEEFGCGTWAVLGKSSGKLVGSIGIELAGWPNEPDGWWKVPELTVHLGTHYQRKGLGPEAGLAVLNWAFTTRTPALEELLAVTLPENCPSQKMMERIGMVRDSSVHLDARTDVAAGTAPLEVVAFRAFKAGWTRWVASQTAEVPSDLE